MLPAITTTTTQNCQLDSLFYSAQVEFDHWERLSFSFDMDNDPYRRHPAGSSSRPNAGTRDPSSPSPNRPPRTSMSTHLGGFNQPQQTSEALPAQEAAFLAQLSAQTPIPRPGGFPQSHEELERTLRYMRGAYPSSSVPDPIGQPFIDPPQSPQLYWQARHSHEPSASSHHRSAQMAPSYPGLGPNAPQGPRSQYPTGQLSDFSPSHGPMMPSASSPYPTSPPSAGEDVELTEAERIAIAEDKRRRNTAASARFRVKKKEQTRNLEQSVSELTGRAEELEREAAELRRENGWLKEIVTLKESRHATLARGAGDVDAGGDGGATSSDSDDQEGSAGNGKGKAAKGRAKGKGKRKATEK